MSAALDQFLRSYDFRMRYARRVAAEPAAVWDALLRVRADELPLTQLLLSLRTGRWRRISGPLTESIRLPQLARIDGRELVYGTIAKFWQRRPTQAPVKADDAEAFVAFNAPGWAKAALSFQIAPDGHTTLLAAETRILATDSLTRCIFGMYWLFIRTGAGLIRQEMLTAIARRAETSTRSP